MATRRIVNAISFGVFCRFAPSTIPIIRSRNASPGLTLMRTMIQSDKTRVPPVTESKSLPAARITGALSPVIALSLIEATPTITSPSPGTRSPCSTNTMSPLRRFDDGVAVCGASRSARNSRLAVVSLRALLSEAACALLRPSAIASAKFAKSSVTQSQRVMARMNPAGASPWPNNACSHRIVVRMLPM
jgi:hypothetical protein